MEKKLISTGLDIDRQEIEQALPEKHLMGAVSTWEELKKTSEDWVQDFLNLPAETQFGARIETMGCTGYGFNKIIALIAKVQEKLNWNLSDRFTNKISNTTRQGNTVDAPVDAVRKNGFLFEDEYPWDRNSFDWDDYYAPIPADKLSLARKRMDEWDFAHEYVPVGNKQAIINALKTSPLGGTVFAWQKDSNGIYYDGGNRANHYTVVILGYVYGKYWICGDTYPEDYQYNDNPKPEEFLKKLDWNYRFGCIKRYKLIHKKKELSLTTQLKNMIKDIWMWFETVGSPKGVRAYFVPKDSQGNIKGKQEINLEDPVLAIKALYSALFNAGVIKKTDWGEISSIEDKKFI